MAYQIEARATLARQSDPSIRQALISLGALHDGFEARKYSCGVEGSSTLICTQRGLDAYNMAISSLASRLGEEPSRDLVCSALLCCQLFISIETMLGNFTAGLRHLIYGLRIMHQYRSRSIVRDDCSVLLCSDVHLPALDSFVIKLFASGYPADKETAGHDKGHVSHVPVAASIMLCKQARRELAALSAQVLEFQGKLSGMRNHRSFTELQAWREQILHLLQSWEHLYSSMLHELLVDRFAISVRFEAAFSVLLHRVLNISVSLAMSSSSDDLGTLENEFQTLNKFAAFVTEVRKIGAETSS